MWGFDFFIWIWILREWTSWFVISSCRISCLLLTCQGPWLRFCFTSFFSTPSSCTQALSEEPAQVSGGWLITSPEQEGYVAMVGVGTWGGAVQWRHCSMVRQRLEKKLQEECTVHAPYVGAEGKRRQGGRGQGWARLVLRLAGLQGLRLSLGSLGP